MVQSCLEAPIYWGLSSISTPFPRLLQAAVTQEAYHGSESPVNCLQEQNASLGCVGKTALAAFAMRCGLESCRELARAVCTRSLHWAVYTQSLHCSRKAHRIPPLTHECCCFRGYKWSGCLHHFDLLFCQYHCRNGKVLKAWACCMTHSWRGLVKHLHVHFW